LQAEIAVLCPVLGRPDRARQLQHSLIRNSSTSVELTFLCSRHDVSQIRACQATGAQTLVVPWPACPGDWAKKLNWGRHHTSAPLMLLAADDLRFHPGWDLNVLRHFNTHDIGVLGTQDGGNPMVKAGRHSTHPVVCRGYADSYGTVDSPDLMVHTGYSHAYCDNELVETARARGCWLFADDVYIEHLHPAWKKARWDSTYARGRAGETNDRKLFMRRRKLWSRTGRADARPAPLPGTSSGGR
jgi:hypothetical protein